MARAAAWMRAAFNVGANNRDDHARNVAFLMDPDGARCHAQRPRADSIGFGMR